tara:strand:+ start:297 stop:635 length:339 start_codon:yes stop_codon:yes gene_type:complete
MNYPLTGKETEDFFEEWGFLIHESEEGDGGFYGWERWQLNAVKKSESKWSGKDYSRIWSVVESGECGCLWICAGERSVNVVHYMVSTKPWDDLKLEWLDYECRDCKEEERDE